MLTCRSDGELLWFELLVLQDPGIAIVGRETPGSISTWNKWTWILLHLSILIEARGLLYVAMKKKLLHGCSKHAFKYAKWSPPNLNQWFISKTLPSNQTGKTLLETQPPWCLLQRGFLIRTSSPVTRTSLRCAKRWVLRKVNDKFVKRPNRIATMELPARSCFHHSRPTSRQFGTFGNV